MKRFTETTKWEKTWFQELSPHLKCLWLYMCDRADSAGVWEPNWKLASIIIGKTVSKADLEHFKSQVLALNDGKYLIRAFVSFQYGKLSEECRAHIPIFRLIEKHRVSIGYPMGMDSHKEQEQEEEQEKETEEEKPKIEEPKVNKARGTLEEIAAYCKEVGLTHSDAESSFHKWEGNGWSNGGEPIKDWRATIRSWKAAGYMPSQKSGITPSVFRRKEVSL